VTLPLSYSRACSLTADGKRRPLLTDSSRTANRLDLLVSADRTIVADSLHLRPPRLLAHARAKGFGEGRTRTFEAARATDLQSAAFDRFATSPAVCMLETLLDVLTLSSRYHRAFTLLPDGAGEGI
jgi:hypothetical protein